AAGRGVGQTGVPVERRREHRSRRADRRERHRAGEQPRPILSPQTNVRPTFYLCYGHAHEPLLARKIHRPREMTDSPIVVSYPTVRLEPADLLSLLRLVMSELRRA